jgi:hypothetical protein
VSRASPEAVNGSGAGSRVRSGNRWRAGNRSRSREGDASREYWCCNGNAASLSMLSPSCRALTAVPSCRRVTAQHLDFGPKSSGKSGSGEMCARGRRWPGPRQQQPASSSAGRLDLGGGKRGEGFCSSSQQLEARDQRREETDTRGMLPASAVLGWAPWLGRAPPPPDTCSTAQQHSDALSITAQQPSGTPTTSPQHNAQPRYSDLHSKMLGLPYGGFTTIDR